MCVVTWNMSWGCFLTWGDTSEEDCDLFSMHTLLPGRVRAREGKERTTTELSSTRDQNEYISGETQTFVSLSCQLSTPELQHVCCSYPGGVTESRIWGIIRGMAHHTYGGWTPPRASARRVELLRIWGGDTRPEMRLDSQRWILRLDSPRQNIPTTNNGTF